MLAFLNAKWLPPEARQLAPEPLLELDLGFPAQHLPGSGDIGLAELRIVHGQRLEDDLTLRRRDLDDCLRKFQNRKLIGVSEVDRQVVLALGERVDAADQILDVAEAPLMLALSYDDERRVLERLPHEGRDRAPVVRAH